MPDFLTPVVYQLKIVLLGISPMIWRRLLVCSDSTIADLYYTLQIALGWSDSHLHQFMIYGKRYGIAQIGGVWFSDDPTQVKLSEFGFRVQEKFLYEYDFGDNWQLYYSRRSHCSSRFQSVLPGVHCRKAISSTGRLRWRLAMHRIETALLCWLCLGVALRD